MKKLIAICGLVALSLAGASVGAERYVREPRYAARSISNAAPSTSDDQDDAPDFSDNSIMLGMSHDVFVGKILAQVGNESFPPVNIASAQFSVEVIANIKGNLHGIVIVSQFEGVYPLVQVGSTYVLATRISGATGWYTFVSPYSYPLLSSDPRLSDADLTALAESNDIVIALRQAYPNEILQALDQTYNSYNSRHYEANGQLIDDTVVLAQQRPVLSPTFEPSPAAESISPSVAPDQSTTLPAETSSPVPSSIDGVPEPSTSASASVSPSVAPDQSTTLPAETSSPAPSPTDSVAIPS